MVNSGKMEWATLVDEICIKNFSRKNLNGTGKRPRPKWEQNITRDLMGKVGGYRLDSSDFR
jgi:hypothetical protein